MEKFKTKVRRYEDALYKNFPDISWAYLQEGTALGNFCIKMGFEQAVYILLADGDNERFEKTTQNRKQLLQALDLPVYVIDSQQGLDETIGLLKERYD